MIRTDRVADFPEPFGRFEDDPAHFAERRLPVCIDSAERDRLYVVGQVEPDGEFDHPADRLLPRDEVLRPVMFVIGLEQPVEPPDRVRVDAVVRAGDQVAEPEQLDRLRKAFCAGFDREAVPGGFGSSGLAGKLGVAASEQESRVADRQGGTQEVLAADIVATVERKTFELPFGQAPEPAEIHA